MRITLRKLSYSLKLISIIIASGFITPAISCPDGATVLNTESYKLCYWYHDNKHVFEKMNKECADYVSGATLAEIPDTEALSKIATMSVPSGISWPVWIGYTDKDVEGTFQSINGFSGNNLWWYPGEPNGGSSDNCVVLFRDGKMRTRSCSDEYNSICSKVEIVKSTRTTLTNAQTTSADSTESSSTTLPTTSTTRTPEPTTTTTGKTTTPESTTDTPSTTRTPETTTTSTTTTPETQTTISTTTTPETITTTTTTTPETTTRTSTTPDITTRKTETTHNGKCFCPMSCNFNMTEKELQQRIEEIKSILALDVKNLNSFKRSKASVYEDRPIPAGLGALGISILCSLAIPLILIDAVRCVKWLLANQERRAENFDM